MAICVLCGTETQTRFPLCAYHAYGESGWAVVNKIMCDWIHRGDVPIRLTAEERWDDQVTGVENA